MTQQDQVGPTAPELCWEKASLDPDLLLRYKYKTSDAKVKSHYDKYHSFKSKGSLQFSYTTVPANGKKKFTKITYHRIPERAGLEGT